jgi:hypothetical protein
VSQSTRAVIRGDLLKLTVTNIRVNCVECFVDNLKLSLQSDKTVKMEGVLVWLGWDLSQSMPSAK